MPIDWKPFVEFVDRHRRFLLTTHVRPDADGLGSMLALAEVLQQMGKDVNMVIASNWPPRYDFLDPNRRIERFAPPGEKWSDIEATVILDTGTWNQLGDFGDSLKPAGRSAAAGVLAPADKVVIDHHISQDELGALQLVDTSSEATGRLVYEAIAALGMPIPESAAGFLFAALAMDTGWFRHANTTAATFMLAEKLVQAGAKPTELYEQLFEQNTLPRLKLTGLVLSRLQTAHDGLTAYTEVRLADYPATGAMPPDTEDLINYCRSLTGVEVAIFFMEQPAGGVKVSFRARERIDVAKLAEEFGGGGHRRASGAILQATLDGAKKTVLAKVEEMLNAS